MRFWDRFDECEEKDIHKDTLCKNFFTLHYTSVHLGAGGDDGITAVHMKCDFASKLLLETCFARNQFLFAIGLERGLRCLLIYGYWFRDVVVT